MVKADQGGETPLAAVNGYVLTYGRWTLRDDEIGIRRWLSKDNSATLLDQRREIIETIRRVENRSGNTIELSMAGPETHSVVEIGNNRATVTVGMHVSFRPPDSFPVRYQGSTKQWTFLTVKERSGWKVAELHHPKLCGEHFKPDHC